MLLENIDKIWDDFAMENQQKGEFLGRTMLVYELLLKAYKHNHPTETLQQLKVRLNRMTTEQLLKSLDKIVENAFVTKEIIE